MSLAANGQYVTCDAGCGACAPAPVGLRAVLEERHVSALSGWLFVTTPGATRHFCPKCAPAYLRTRSHEAAGYMPTPGPASLRPTPNGSETE
ncbi:MAG: hypothetical protein ACLQVD_07010 [Capsulimonadaceae bacterium]